MRNALGDEDVPGTLPLLKYRFENPELKPELEAIFTLQQIEDWCHKWVLDEYHFTNSYNNHVPAPYLRREDAQCGKGELILPLPREPPSDPNQIDMLYLSTLTKFERTLQYSGVVWEYLKYTTHQACSR